MSTGKEARHEEYLPSPHGKKDLSSKNMGKNHCTHCNMSGHRMEKCWKLHPQIHPKKDKKVVQAPVKEVTNEKVEHAITIHEAVHEEDQLNKENPLAWLSKKWVAYLNS
jgi:hypothetical protein